MPGNGWEEVTKYNNSTVDHIAEGVPKSDQMMEVMEHVLHHITDMVWSFPAPLFPAPLFPDPQLFLWRHMLTSGLHRVCVYTRAHAPAGSQGLAPALPSSWYVDQVACSLFFHF